MAYTDAWPVLVREERQGDDEHGLLGRPFRVVARLKNNRLIRAREALGYTPKQVAAASGVDYQTVLRYEGFTYSPRSPRDSGWKRSAERLAQFYGYSMDELWPDAIDAVTRTRAEVEVGGQRARALLIEHDDAAPDAQTARAELRAAVAGALATLTDREQRVLRARFGLNEQGQEQTLAELGKVLGVSRDRVCQIEARALRKLRHPSRAKRVAPFVPGAATEVVCECGKWRGLCPIIDTYDWTPPRREPLCVVAARIPVPDASAVVNAITTDNDTRTLIYRAVLELHAPAGNECAVMVRRNGLIWEAYGWGGEDCRALPRAEQPEAWMGVRMDTGVWVGALW